MSSHSVFPPTLDEIIDEFDHLEDWEERYEYLIELGRELRPLDESVMQTENIVQGCMSTVWLVADFDERGRMRVRADSDSLIVKGLIVVLMAAYTGKTLEQVLTFDPRPIFDRLGLGQHLSPNRRNGLNAMVQRVRELATSS